MEQWKAQNERRVQTVLPAFLLHSSLELLSCSPALLNFFTFFISQTDIDQELPSSGRSLLNSCQREYPLSYLHTSRRYNQLSR